MKRPAWLIGAALLVAALQIGVLAWSIAGRAAILRDGREVLLKVEPIDPRDLLRGDYVTLGYEISRIPASMIAVPDSADEPATVHVRLEPGADGLWHATATSFLPLPEAGSDAVDMRGTARLDRWSAGADIPVTYGIERYFVPEGEGRAIEADMRERDFFVRVAVSDGGTPAIKALLDGESVLYEEPLY